MKTRKSKIEYRGEIFYLLEVLTDDGKVCERRILDFEVDREKLNHWARKEIENYFAKKLSTGGY